MRSLQTWSTITPMCQEGYMKIADQHEVLGVTSPNKKKRVRG